MCGMCDIAIRFQFQYGAIKGACGLSHVDSEWVGFQFQYGAIKGGPYRGYDAIRYLFQFQYGAIKGLLRRLVHRGAACFNSSMVRLKEAQHSEHATKSLVSIPVWCD